MTEGKTISLVRDDQPPATSPNTRLIAGALTSGAEFASEKSFLDTLEKDPQGGPDKRQVTWCMDGDKLMEFLPEFKAERITFDEFKKRFLSREWCLANPHHPISFMHGYSEMLNRLRDKVRTMKPMVLIRRGKKTALIPADASDADKAKILCHL